MEKTIKEFFEGFIGGAKGLATVILTISMWGICIVGSWCILIWLVKSAWFLFLDLVVLL
jgi:hypothetical protein